MAYAVHTMMALNKKPSASERPQAADPSLTTPSTPTTTPAATPVAPTLGGTGAPTVAPTDTSTPLIAAVKPPADAGQLQSFSLFESKDPFHASGPNTPGGSSSSTKSGGSKSGGGGGAPKAPPAPPTPAPTSAVIAVNGTAESVTSGANFPAADPMFQLISLTSSTAKISVVGGSYADGAATLTLKVNRAVTLANTADGTRYTIELMPQGTVASTSSSGAAASTSDTSTIPTPVTTTTTTTSG
jgi:hypothetical protein